MSFKIYSYFKEAKSAELFLSPRSQSHHVDNLQDVRNVQFIFKLFLIVSEVYLSKPIYIFTCGSDTFAHIYYLENTCYQEKSLDILKLLRMFGY